MIVAGRIEDRSCRGTALHDECTLIEDRAGCTGDEVHLTFDAAAAEVLRAPVGQQRILGTDDLHTLQVMIVTLQRKCNSDADLILRKMVPVSESKIKCFEVVRTDNRGGGFRLATQLVIAVALRTAIVVKDGFTNTISEQRKVVCSDLQWLVVGSRFDVDEFLVLV